MNQIKTNIINVIKNIPDDEASTTENLLSALITKLQALEALDDVKNDNVITIEQLRRDVASWK